MISIIIPAHNEANVIEKTLIALLPGLINGEVELIVVCNACSDNTIEVVRKFSDKVKCVESPIASKTHALNLGDKVASSFPRVYLDADVILPYTSLKKLAGVLKQGQYLAAAPTMRMDFTNASWVVKSYYDVWQQLSYVKEGMIGTGVYALSEAGRRRFEEFPDVIADDGFVRAMFDSKERTAVGQCYSLVCAPSNLPSLIKIKTRSRLGRYELAKKFPELLKNEQKKYYNSMLFFITKPHCWIKLPVYVYVNMVARMRAKKYYQLHGFSGWERDETSRVPNVPSAIS